MQARSTKVALPVGKQVKRWFQREGAIPLFFESGIHSMRCAFEGSADTSDAGSLFPVSQDGLFLLLGDSPRLWGDGEGFVALVASSALRPGLGGSVLDDILWLLAGGAANANRDHDQRLPG